MSVSLERVRAISDGLFSTLTQEAWLTRPVAERHRLLFYLGHLEAFDWNTLVKAPSLNAPFEKLFALGIDPIDDLPADRPEDWPRLEVVRAWGAEARAQVDARKDLTELESFVVAEHRLMHVETLSYLFENLAPGLRVVPAPSTDESKVPAQQWLEVAAGPVELGSRTALAWCNERQGHSVNVPRFFIESRKTTIGDWLQFVEAGGYHERRYWSDADWQWRQKIALEAPLSWRPQRRQWVNGHDLALLESWPVYVTHAEASAYAVFRGAQLPTEAQWHRAVHGSPEGVTRPHPWGEAPPVAGQHGNFGFAHRHPTSVGAHPAGVSAFGLDEPVGNGWEWTSTAFAAFAGFERMALYPGYSEPFFDGHHFVLLGASAVTGLPLVRRPFRNWYQPHYRAPFAAVRLARNTA